MGNDKALLPFLGIPLIDRLQTRFLDLGEEMLVITNTPAAYGYLDLPLYKDLVPDRGALGGLFTALSVAKYPHVGLIAADLPFASPKLLKALVQRLHETGVDAVLPSTPGGMEPLHAVYRRDSCLPLVEKAIKDDLWKMDSWHNQADILVVSPDETREFSQSDHTFWNLNTPEDFQKAEEIAVILGME